jgi:hypothetical protein
MRGLVQAAVVTAALVSGCDSHQVSSKGSTDTHSSSTTDATHSAVASRPCQRVEFDDHTYLLTRSPPGAGPGVGRILGIGRTEDCRHEAAGQGVRVYSVNEEGPARAVTISQGGKVWLYTRR